MGKKDPRVDAYIARSARFAQPVLKHIRKLVHSACPEVEETIKWGSPTFVHHGILCGMAAFKEHCAFGFWNQAVVDDKKGGAAMGQFGRIGGVADLPSDAQLKRMIGHAAQLNEDGIKPRRAAKKVKQQPLVVPDGLAAALKKNKKAQATFDGFSYSNKKEYVEWISEAKREETRQKRLATALEWLAQGKTRNWKYENC